MVSSFILMTLIQFEFILLYGRRGWPSFISYTSLSNFPNTIVWIDYLYPIVCSCFLCHGLIGHIGVGLFLGFLFCSIDLCVCFYASTMLFWLLWPCSIVLHQVTWFLQLCSSFSRLLRLFWVFCGSIKIFGIFVLVLWGKSLAF